MRLYQIYSKINKSVKGRQKTTLFYRGSDQGGGVGGVNYTEYANGNELNYKIYNLRGDLIKTINQINQQSHLAITIYSRDANRRILLEICLFYRFYY